LTDEMEVDSALNLRNLKPIAANGNVKIHLISFNRKLLFLAFRFYSYLWLLMLLAKNFALNCQNDRES
jgi:hypothetical protein